MLRRGLVEGVDGGPIKRLSAGRPCLLTWHSPLSLSPMSALKRIADSCRTLRHVRLVPNSEVNSCYSITSSARERSAGGRSRPMLLAVLRLTINSK